MGVSLLATLGLSADAIAARRSCIGGSDANVIMGGNPDRLLSLWRLKRGEAEGDDLSGILAVQMGSFTEPLNAAWFEKQTGDAVVNRGDIAQHPAIAYMRGTLDGRVYDAFGNRYVWEAKHVGVRQTDAEIFARYVPQLAHNRICDDADGAYLSVIKGNGDWLMWEYAPDADYEAQLLEREASFWECVLSGEPPVPLPPAPAPKPKGVKEYDLTGSNEWASHAADYRDTILAVDRHEIAKKALKSLVPDDASKCAGHGITITRTKAGALRFASQEA